MPCTNAQVTAASTAFPPRLRTSAPASTAIGSGPEMTAAIGVLPYDVYVGESVILYMNMWLFERNLVGMLFKWRMSRKWDLQLIFDYSLNSVKSVQRLLFQHINETSNMSYWD
jgi:hypothetical protein